MYFSCRADFTEHPEVFHVSLVLTHDFCMKKDAQVTLTDFSEMLSLYLNRIGWSLTSQERRILMNYRKLQSRITLKSANSSWEKTNANLIQKENLRRWSLVKFLICRIGSIVFCHSMPWLQFWTLQIEAVGFDRSAVSGHFSQNSKTRRKPKLFFCQSMIPSLFDPHV